MTVICERVCAPSEVESSQQPAEEAGPLGSEETNEEVDHSGDEDDTCGDVVQVVESLLIGHHIQVPAGYNTHTNMRADRCTYTQIQIFPAHTHTNTCIQMMLPPPCGTLTITPEMNLTCTVNVKKTIHI